MAGDRPRRARRLAAPAVRAGVISVIDVGGALALMQKAFEDYRTANPKLVSRIAFVKAPAPELASKIKAQQEAGRADLDLVLTGSDGLAAGPRAEALAEDPARLRRQVPQYRGQLRAGRAHPAQGPGRRLRRRRELLPLRPAARIRARARQGGADHGRGAARLGQGQSQPLHVCPPDQFRPRPHLHDGPALYPRRQGPAGPGRWLGQDLGLSRRNSDSTSSITLPAPARR